MHTTPHRVSEFYSEIRCGIEEMRNVYTNLFEKSQKRKLREIGIQLGANVIKEINRCYEGFIAVLIEIQFFLEYDAVPIGVIFQKGLYL
jgi:hypothetical protein